MITADCSGLLGRTSLRLFQRLRGGVVGGLLFRPSRPDFIETYLVLVPVNSVSILFRPSRPDFIETKVLWVGPI